MNPNNEFVHESLKKIIVEEDPNAFNSAAARVDLTKLTTQAEKDNNNQSFWYLAGKRAKQRGYGDFSPFYKNATADYFFKCGYDNVPFVEAQQVLKDKIQQIMETDPLLTEVTDEYAKAAKQLDLK